MPTYPSHNFIAVLLEIKNENDLSRIFVKYFRQNLENVYGIKYS